MVNRRISKDIKEAALRLWNVGWETEEICFALAISRSSMYRWQSIFDEHGTVNRPKSPLIGRPRILTRALMTAGQTLFQEESDLYLDEVVTWLALTHDIVISSSTLSRNLKEAGLTRKLLHKIAVERDEQLRQEWRESIQANFLGDGSQFIFLDETSKNERTWARHHGRSMSGEAAHLTDVFVRGDRYSLVAALTRDGYIAAHAVMGSFDSIEFYNFVAEQVVQFCVKHFILHALTVL
jgi:transposase